MTPIKMLTIPEAVNKCEGIGDYTLRKWIREGSLPSVKIGKKYLINEQVLEDFLKGESFTTPAQNDSVCKIKPIKVRSNI